MSKEGGTHRVKKDGPATGLGKTKPVRELPGPVCQHLRTSPNTGLKKNDRVQGREQKPAEKPVKHARKINQTGENRLVWEWVPPKIAQNNKQTRTTTTTGKGASNQTDENQSAAKKLEGPTPGKLPRQRHNYSPQKGTKTHAIEENEQKPKARQLPTQEHDRHRRIQSTSTQPLREKTGNCKLPSNTLETPQKMAKTHHGQ